MENNILADIEEDYKRYNDTWETDTGDASFNLVGKLLEYLKVLEGKVQLLERQITTKI